MASNIIELHTQVPADLEGNVFGQFDGHLKQIERTLNVTLISRDGSTIKRFAPVVTPETMEKDILEMLAYRWHIDIKQRSHRFLGHPDGFISHNDLHLGIIVRSVV